MQPNQITKTSKKKAWGVALIVGPPIFLILLFIISAVGNLIFRSLGSEVSFRIFNYVLAILGLFGVFGMLVCLVVGVIFIIQKMEPLDSFDERSGKFEESIIPEEIKGWNWGAAGLTFVWGLYYRAWASLIVFVPFIGVIWPIIAGIKGNEWAWRSNEWQSIEAFKKAQKKWMPWGIIALVVPLLAFIVGSILASFLLSQYLNSY